MFQFSYFEQLEKCLYKECFRAERSRKRNVMLTHSLWWDFTNVPGQYLYKKNVLLTLMTYFTDFNDLLFLLTLMTNSSPSDMQFKKKKSLSWQQHDKQLFVALLIKQRYQFAPWKICSLVNKHLLFLFQGISSEISCKYSGSFRLALFIRYEKPTSRAVLALNRVKSPQQHASP